MASDLSNDYVRYKKFKEAEQVLNKANPPALQQVYVDYTKTRIGALSAAKN